MLIDIIFLVFLVIGIIKGYRQGILKSIFTVASLIIGVLLALKFSYLASDYISQNIKVPPQWLPAISFAVVMIGALVVVQFIGKAIESLLKVIQLNFINRLGGMILWATIKILMLSIFVWLVNQTGGIKPELKAASITYPFLEFFGPTVINFIGEIFPPFKGIFESIESLFIKWSDIQNIIPGQ